MRNERIIVVVSVFILFFSIFVIHNYSKLDSFFSGFVTSDSVAPIFSIRIIDFQSPSALGEFLKFSYFVRSISGVNGSAQVNFWLEKEGEVITLGSDSIYLGNFEEKTRDASIFLPSNLKSGIYNLEIEVDYNKKIIRSFRTIEIKVFNGAVTINSGAGNFITYIVLLLVLLAVLNIIFLYLLEKEKIKEILINKKNFIKKHRLSILTFTFFLIIGGLVYYLNLMGALFGIPVYFYYSLLGFLLLLILGKDILKNKSEKIKNSILSENEKNYLL